MNNSHNLKSKALHSLIHIVSVLCGEQDQETGANRDLEKFFNTVNVMQKNL